MTDKMVCQRAITALELEDGSICVVLYSRSYAELEVGVDRDPVDHLLGHRLMITGRAKMHWIKNIDENMRDHLLDQEDQTNK